MDRAHDGPRGPHAPERLTTIRDRLYDRILLRPREVALLHTPAFVRLEGIKQLGFVARVWPSATHTRFEHSLGVLALTRRALAALRPALASALPLQPADHDALAAAALLHDIGHYPFSHAIEELGPPVLRHEAVGRTLIEQGAVAEVLERAWGLDPRRVANLVDPRAPLPPVDRLLVGLLSGTLDMDKLDYLPRDAQACNVPYGRVDTPRLLAALTVAEVAGTRRIIVTDKGISPLHSLINARQEMFDNVYWHHTNRACMVMLLRAVQDALQGGAVAPAQLPQHDDASLLALLSQARMPPSTRALVALLRARQVHKRAMEVSARAGALYARLGALYANPTARRTLEQALAARLTEHTGVAVADYEVLIDIPKPERWTTEVWVHFARPPVGLQALLPWPEVVGLGDADFKRYEEHRRLIRIVTTERLRDVVRGAWDAVVQPCILQAGAGGG
jgi:HD superfamily phosphohydrolase